VTLGALEWIDLQSAVDYLETRDDVDPERIGAFGLSLGGSVAILAAAKDPRIRAVVADSAFSDATNVISRGFKLIFHLPSFPFAPITVRFAEWKTGARVHAIRPANVIGQISPRPILLIQGEEDSLVTPKNASENFAAAREPKEIWWVPGADHVEASAIMREEYEDRIVAFFCRALNVLVEDQTGAGTRARQ
jgi:fermentation-respiration switch protein FrsA (DUF1100 family)